EVGGEARERLLEPGQLGARQLRELGVVRGQRLLVVGDGGLDPAVVGEHLHRLLERGAFLRQLAQALGVARHLRAAEQGGQLREAILDPLEGVPHGYWMNATSGRAELAARSSSSTRSSPRTRSIAAIETSHIERSGSRVVRRWNWSPGHTRARTTGFAVYRAEKRMNSNATPAMSGMQAIRSR